MAPKYRRPMPDFRPDRAAIMAKVDAYSEINLVTGCWDWQGQRNALLYGMVYWARKNWTATRLIYNAINGPFDVQLDVCHSCDNPMCVNPEHLRVDTHRNNLLDASKRGRLQGQWKTHCKRGHPLEGDNLYRDPGTEFRHCKLCGMARMRRRAGWPEHLWYSDIRVPPGCKLNFETGEFVHARSGRPVQAAAGATP